MNLRHSVCAAFVVIGLSMSSVGAYADGQFEIKIETTDAATALNQLSRQTDYPLLFNYEEIKSLRVNSLNGNYTLNEALELMFEGTGFEGHLTNREVLTVSQVKSINDQLKGDDMIKIDNKARKSLLGGVSAVVLTALASPAAAQDGTDEVIATGIRQSLNNALLEKREADSLVEIILAEDIGKLPDQNLAEVLENITGIQITRTAGIGTGVQIRGTNANRTEINGVSTLDSGSGRGGINFEDVNASIIAGVEVIKVPEAGTIEGSVGGTINLRTIRPLDLDGPLLAARAQAEDSNLSVEGLQPRFSAAAGNKWETGFGDVGLVISGSYTEQEAVSFRPRTDRDNLTSVDIDGDGVEEEFLAIQFLVQEQENNDFETINLAGTAEWEPNDELRFYFDGFYNDQQVASDQYRLQASGISSFAGDVIPTAFETVDFSTGLSSDQVAGLTDVGMGPGVIPAAIAGTIARNGINDDNGNLRFSSETSARETESTVLAIGGEWERDNWKFGAEFARSRSDTNTSQLDATLNFINPNSNLVGDVVFVETDAAGNFLFEDFNGDETTSPTGIDADGNVVEFDPVIDDINVGFGVNPTFGGANITSLQDAVDAVPNAFLTDLDLAILLGRATPGQVATVNQSQIFNDNSTPFVFDLSGESLSFGIAFDDPEAPTPEQLLDPNNVVLDQAIITDDFQRNEEDAVRFDVAYDFSDNDLLGGGLSSFEAGYRYNRSSSINEDFDDNIGGFSVLEDSPNGSLFAELLVPGPTNFDDADGRDLFISNFLLVDPDVAFSDREGTVDTLEAALATQRGLNPLANGELTSEPELDSDAFFEVEEDTHAVYGQINFESGIFRGNLGARYVSTDVESTGFQGDDLVTFDGSYDFLLPRFNLIANATDNIAIRLGYASDILRPSFNSLGGFSFNQSENAAVSIGNPSLSPETVDSFDVGFEWYFAPASVLSIGFFDKSRTNIFSNESSFAELIEGPNEVGFTGTGGFSREINPECPGGGIFNPEVIPNVLGDPQTTGLCVDLSQPVNDPAQTNQRGVEVAFQGDLSSFEDRLGWASGFGLQANYTYQEFSGGSALDTASGRGDDVLGDISIPEGLLDFSQNAYNITGFYERYGLSARLRYTWRDEFRTNDFGGGANVSGSSTFGFPVITEARGQLNGSISYDVTEQFSVGVEATNITTSNIVQRAVTPDGPIAFVGFPDRRVIFGGRFRY